jgi:hypothetical protein
MGAGLILGRARPLVITLSSSEPGEDFIMTKHATSAGTQRLIGRSTLVAMMGGLALLGPLSVDA